MHPLSILVFIALLVSVLSSDPVIPPLRDWTGRMYTSNVWPGFPVTMQLLNKTDVNIIAAIVVVCNDTATVEIGYHSGADSKPGIYYRLAHVSNLHDIPMTVFQKLELWQTRNTTLNDTVLFIDMDEQHFTLGVLFPRQLPNGSHRMTRRITNIPRNGRAPNETYYGLQTSNWQLSKVKLMQYPGSQNTITW